MKNSSHYETSRRAFLQTCAAGWGASNLLGAIGAPAKFPETGSGAILRVEADHTRPLVPVLSWDTEGGERFHTNLLREGSGIGLRVLVDGKWCDGTTFPTEAGSSGEGVRYRLRTPAGASLTWEVAPRRDHLTMSFSSEGSASVGPGTMELVFPFDPLVTPTTILPSEWNPDDSVRPPMVISAPDFGQMLVDVQPVTAKARLEGSRDHHIVDLVLTLPQIDANHPCSITFSPVVLPEPEGMEDKSLWRAARRAWFNAFQPSARWGEQGRAFSAPAGILANNVLSDPCSFSLIFYADHMLWTPTVAPHISVATLVRQAVDFWLDQRTRTSGEVVGYWDYTNFLDANTGPVICGWDYVEATGDLNWLEKRIKQLESAADYHARRDQDFDGLVEATQSGNANTLWEPDRSCNWFDAINHGCKDAYSNALIYRSWRCLAHLESKLHRGDQQARYTQLADRLKAAYRAALYNPETGWIADWRSEDGKLHDYASPTTNGMAIEYGLVGAEEGRRIIARFWDKMQAAGFHRFDLGIPPNLEPIHRSDYLRPDGFGCPHNEDGADSFQQYENGGISAGHSAHFLAACYRVGEQKRADSVLQQMLGREQGNGFQNGVQNQANQGIDWTTWDGKPCGYEGYLADVYYFLTAAVLRESRFRERYYRPFAAA